MKRIITFIVALFMAVAAFGQTPIIHGDKSIRDPGLCECIEYKAYVIFPDAKYEVEAFIYSDAIIILMGERGVGFFKTENPGEWEDVSGDKFYLYKSPALGYYFMAEDIDEETDYAFLVIDTDHIINDFREIKRETKKL